LLAVAATVVALLLVTGAVDPPEAPDVVDAA